MRHLSYLTVFVFAIFAAPVATQAGDPAVPPAGSDYGNAAQPDQGGLLAPLYQENGFDNYRREADIGSPGSAGFGFPHFSLPFQNYTLWHRPKAATLTKWQRCAKDEFHPRGFGHLFARPCDSFRIDYSPHRIDMRRSSYGPTYLLRSGNQKCDHCNCAH